MCDGNVPVDTIIELYHGAPSAHIHLKKEGQTYKTVVESHDGNVVRCSGTD